jgi:hypothetical protein
MAAALDYQMIVRAVAGDKDAERVAAAAALEALRKWFLAGETRPFADYLPGVAGHDRRHQKLARRDYWLIRAHGLCDGGTPWLKSVALEREIGRFERCIWPSWCELEAPPGGASELRIALFNAFKVACRMNRVRGNGIPATARRIDQILKSAVSAVSQEARDDAGSSDTNGESNDKCEQE